MKNYQHSLLLAIMICGCSQLSFAQSRNLKDKNRPDAYAFVEQMPEFPGGTKAMYDYLASLVVADSSLVRDINGYVIVQFYVEKDGSITSPKILRNSDPVSSEQVVNYISPMPKWKPALMNDKAVVCLFTLPVKFRPINFNEKN